MTDRETRRKNYAPSTTLEQSYRLCTQRVGQELRRYAWMTCNLANPEKRHLHALLAWGLTASKLCDIHLDKTARAEQLAVVKDEFRDNLMREFSTGEFPALVDTMERFDLPQQYIYDALAAADLVLRMDRISSFDQWLQLGCRLGGSVMLGVAAVFDAKRSGFKEAAMSCGQAVYLTQLLARIGTDTQAFEFFMPQDNVEQFEVDVASINPERPEKSVLRLIQYLATRIEPTFESGSQIVKYVSFDGRRAITSAISMFWEMLIAIKRDPGRILLGQGEPSASQRFQLKMKHVLGLEGGVSVLPDQNEH